MKPTISSIPQLYRNAVRWTEIISVLSRYGLANWMARFNIDFIADRLCSTDGEKLRKLTQASRIRLALTELGPTFIKFGQLLSTRPDLIGSELAEELSSLQSSAPADDFATVRSIIETEQGKPLDELFLEFDPTPVASASIGQVHRAKIEVQKYPSFRTIVGEEVEVVDVAVKVRHAGISQILETDLDIMSGLAQLAERLDDFKMYQPVAVVRDLTQVMKRELDFEREHRNLLQFRSQLSNEPQVRLPAPVAGLCSSKILTMDWVDGIPLRDFARQCRADPRCVEMAETGAKLYLTMIFKHGFFHADPHPGNIMINEDGNIVMLDFGLVGRISESLRESIGSMLLAMVNQDVTLLTSLIKQIGRCPMNLDTPSLSNDVADFVGQYSTQLISSFDISVALSDFVDIVRRYQITLPSEVSLLLKVIITLEGTGRLLHPGFSLMEIMAPFQRRMLLRRLSPRRQARKLQRFYLGVEQLAEVLPQRINSILEQIQTGRFDVHLEHRRLGPSVNRLVLGIMVSALFLGSSLMLSFEVPPLLFVGGGALGLRNISLIGFAGVIVSLLLGFRLVWAIRKSGNLDHVE